jgi:arylsulfatase A-like enzyme
VPSHDPERPNVLVILTDDQGAWALGAAGNDEIRTPNLDRLADQGMRFENYFCTSPVCSPARATLLTGRIPSQHGVHDWISAGNSTCEPARDGELIEYLQDQTGYTDVLAEHGYDCAMSGKWHLGDCHQPQKGFTFWRAHARGGGDYYHAPMVKNEKDVYFETRYITDVITDNALEFLQEERWSEQPFCLSVHYTAPHSPWNRGQHPPEIFESYYRDCPFESVPDEPQNPWAKQHPNRGFFESPERRREMLSGYYAAVTAMDAAVGRLLAWLDRNALAGNTLIFFTSDNGMNMGHHGICGKGNGTWPLNMYDTSVKVPAIMCRPGHVPAGVVCREMLSHYDWMPTLLDYLGLENPVAGELPGRSFAPILRTGQGTGRNEVVAFHEYGPVRMIRTPDWKYVHRYPDGPHELFDLSADPGERANLFGQAGQEERTRNLRERLDAWFERYVDPEVDGTTKNVRGRGQVGLATEDALGREPFAQDWTPWWRPGHEPK